MIFTLPSGTELDIPSARGDVKRALELLADIRSGEQSDAAWPAVEESLCDLQHVAELLSLLEREREHVREQLSIACTYFAELDECGHNMTAEYLGHSGVIVTPALVQSVVSDAHDVLDGEKEMP